MWFPWDFIQLKNTTKSCVDLGSTCSPAAPRHRWHTEVFVLYPSSDPKISRLQSTVLLAASTQPLYGPSQGEKITLNWTFYQTTHFIKPLTGFFNKWQTLSACTRSPHAGKAAAGTKISSQSATAASCHHHCHFLMLQRRKRRQTGAKLSARRNPEEPGGGWQGRPGGGNGRCPPARGALSRATGGQRRHGEGQGTGQGQRRGSGLSPALLRRGSKSKGRPCPPWGRAAALTHGRSAGGRSSRHPSCTVASPATKRRPPGLGVAAAASLGTTQNHSKP